MTALRPALKLLPSKAPRFHLEMMIRLALAYHFDRSSTSWRRAGSLSTVTQRLLYFGVGGIRCGHLRRGAANIPSLPVAQVTAGRAMLVSPWNAMQCTLACGVWWWRPAAG